MDALAYRPGDGSNVSAEISVLCRQPRIMKRIKKLPIIYIIL